MNIFKTYTFKWWQAGIFKICLLSLGIAIGAYTHQFFTPYIFLLLAIAIITGVYLLFISFKK